MGESSFLKCLEGDLKELRSRNNPYEGIGNAERLIESRNVLEMAALLTGMFFKDIGISENFIQHFECNAEQSIQAACDNTFYLLDGRKMVVLKILERIFSACHVRETLYEQYPPRLRKWKYRQQHFWLRKEDDFLLIRNYKESLMKGNCEHDECDDAPCWLIQEKRLGSLFQKEVEKMLSGNEISSEIADELENDWLRQLRKMQIIYKQRRTDNKWGRPALPYPVYECEVNYGYNGREITCNVECEPVIHMNENHPIIRFLKERIEDNDTEDIDIRTPDEWDVQGMSLDEIYKVRKAFMNSKSLYVE